MEGFTNTKKYKKFIIALVILLLFNFCYPHIVSAKIIDIPLEISKLIFWIERGALKLLNNIFADDDHKFEYTVGAMNASSGTRSITIRVRISPENIIKGKFLIFNANIFEDVNSVTDPEKYYDDGTGKNIVSGRMSLREIVAGWYYALRNFAIVALLSVLVYVGIRMIMSTIAQDKAKYKAMFKDWLIALCLLTLMHYMMITILNVNQMIVDAVGGSGSAGSQTERVMGVIAGVNAADGDEHEYTFEDGVTYNIGDAFSYELLLLAIIVYTVIFAVKYLKREFTIIFLILLGPISCITYPIDKISDGKAQAFNKWFAEFLYNVIVQPFHLLLYIVLVGSATQLAKDNLLYSIVCFAVMIPAEKFIKEMFGFRDKLGSPLGAFATGAVASQLLSKIKGGGGSAKKVGSGEDNESTQRQLPAKTVDEKDLARGNDNNQGRGSERARLGDAPNASHPIANAQERAGGIRHVNDVPPNANEDREHLPEEPDAAEQMSDAQGMQDFSRQLAENADNNDETKEHIAEGPDAAEQMSDAQGREDILRQINQGDDNGDQNRGNMPQTSDAAEQRRQNLLKRAWNSKPVGRIRSIHNERMAKKWGSTSKKQRWINRGKKVGKKGLNLLGNAAKLGVRTAGTLAGAALLGSIGAMTGQGAKGLAAGAALGNSLSNKAIKQTTRIGKNVSSAAADYADGLKSNAQRDKKAFRDYSGDKKNIDRAVLSYRERNEEKDPTYEDLQKDMQDRFDLSRYGLTEDQIDKAIGSYQELKDGGMDKEQALKQAVIEQRLASRYKDKFGKELDMTSAVQALTQSFTDGGMNKELAEGKAREILKRAGKINHETVTLPAPKIPDTLASQTLKARGVSEPTQLQLEQEEELHLRLQEAGFDDNQILQLSALGGNNEGFEMIVTRAINVHTDWQKPKANGEIAQMGFTPNASLQEVNTEFIERVSVEKTFGIKGDTDRGREKIDAIRKFEKQVGASAQQRQLGAKTVRKEISNNDRNAMTDRDKEIAEKYVELATGSKARVKKAPGTKQPQIGTRTSTKTTPRKTTVKKVSEIKQPEIKQPQIGEGSNNGE